MNTKNLHQIFANYIDRFEELNDPEHNETFKWWAAKQFRKQMDAAFKQSGHNFAVALDHIKGHKKEERVVETIIDGKILHIQLAALGNYNFVFSFFHPSPLYCINFCPCFFHYLHSVTFHIINGFIQP